MIIHLIPLICDDVLTAERRGDVLTLNGESFDFTSLPEGGEIALGIVPCVWIRRAVTRTDGHITLTLRLPIPADASEAARFPESIIDPPDGLIALPV